MPRYRLHSDCFLGGKYCHQGEEVEFEGPPNDQMEPLDAEGWEKFYDRVDNQGKKVANAKRYAFSLRERYIEIPDDWREWSGNKLKHLAMQLGADIKINGPKSIEFIEQELARRAAQNLG